MSEPLVSILIPCHNSAPWLAETIESALTQTHPRCEVIVVDDGSTDASAAVAESFKARGVRLHRQPRRGGAAAARNAALQMAQGEFIQFLDADDLLHPEKIKHQVAHLSNMSKNHVATAAWASFHTTPATASFEPEAVWRDASPVDWLVLSWNGGGMMHPAAWLTPREIADRAGPWNESLSLDDDGEYFCRVVLAGSGVSFCGDAKVYYRRHSRGSLSQAKSPAAWHSSHEVCRLVQAAAVAQEDSPRVRHACALNHLRFAFHAWPYARALAVLALAEAKRLDPTAKIPGAGPRFNLIARLIGWRFARVLQHCFSLARPA